MSQQQQQQVHPELQPLVDEYNKIKQKGEDLANKKQQYLTQYNENKGVQNEFENIDEGAAVFKKIGVVLVKQDKEDAKNNVKRRLEMIQGQINDVTKAMKKNDDEEERITKKILTKQRELQQKAAEDAKKQAQSEGQ
mmetsp:Transcript_33163/g.48626  ORF Transcript_33163/g.48626 Transcript_33163/m.48626 type:complete len:137 (-) Transcript_33163:54-464(-)|eukprot:CAMPEP_0195517962 /NCGR_PEP_ID=MMETSP0794_2-20130614/11848_1 /TAXON_ID=515487 /ORGANISM="Stephanopyxis turris, Strain CCMP 815" /LENGTH=136 /DNA_ID=CAMNT_0040646847 /DNA_START=80 /DNA_END=490 /DNA_ORIENTATION=-